jgi:pyruvate-formate lyase-activating enzyme
MSSIKEVITWVAEADHVTQRHFTSVVADKENKDKVYHDARS